MKFRRLAINGKFLGAKPTGVHRVAEQLIRQLVVRRDELAELFPQTPTIIAPQTTVLTHADAFGVERGGFFRGQLWEQLDLPRFAAGDLLLNLCNLGPMASSSAITLIHDAQVFITPESYSWAFARWYQHVLPVLGRRHAKIAAVSNFSAAQLARFGVAAADRIAVIPNGGDHVLGYAARPEIIGRLGLGERKFVVALANLQVHKNIGLLLKAFSAPALAGLKLVLVGSDVRAGFETQGHSIPPNVVFAGRVDDGQLRALLESALCVAFPSTTEGFGLPPLEGMTVGSPAVLAPCGALPEVGGDAALYAAPDDPHQWVEAISALAGEQDTWQRYSHAARQRASLFTWDQAGRKLIEVIRSVVST